MVYNIKFYLNINIIIGLSSNHNSLPFPKSTQKIYNDAKWEIHEGISPSSLDLKYLDQTTNYYNESISQGNSQ